MTTSAQWAKWTRKWHRWISTPMILLIPGTLVLKLTGNGDVLKDVPAIESVQSALFLFLALTGGYLYIFRLVNRSKRSRRIPAVLERDRA